MTLDKYLDLALKAAKESGEYLKARSDIIEEKSEGRDIKLSSDRAAEVIIVDILRESGLPILSEEAGHIGGDAADDMIWIVDPLDGTVNYSRGMDELCCVSVALWKGNEPLLGVVNRFACGEVYHGVAGEGAYLNGTPVKPSGVQNVESAILTGGFPVNFDYSAQNLNSFIKNIQMFKKVRMLGSAALMCVFAATGKMDAYFEDDIMLWDIAGSVAIAKANGCGIALERGENSRCRLKCFANKRLMEDFYDKTI